MEFVQVVSVSSLKGGVGKTTVSRTLLDYFSANNVQTRAFDTESPRGTLKRFHPEITEIVDMTVTLQSSNGDIQLPRQTFTFRHALDSDDER